MAITDYLRKLVELKNQLVVNLKSMGVTADESEKLNTLVPKVLDIETGLDTSDATATAEDILKGKTAYVNDVKVSGTIESKSAEIYTPGTTNKTISAGVYLSGNQTIKGDSNLKSGNIKNGVSIFGVTGTLPEKIDTSDATATAEDILKGKTAYVNDVKVTGTKEEVEQNVEFDEESKIISINIPSGTTSIGNSAFNYLYGLKSITIPASVTSIGNLAFYYCSNLANIYYMGTQEQWNAITKGMSWNNKMGSNVSGGTVIHYNYTG